jgi:hypothetical protein
MSDTPIEFNDDLDFATTKTQVMPAYEYVKRNILYSWFKIETEYQRYVFLKSMGKSYKAETLNSLLITLYKTILRPMMLNLSNKMKDEKLKLFVIEMDGFVKNDFKIPNEKIDDVINSISEFLHSIGLTNISFDVKPWEERFKDEYGVF